MRYPGRSFEHVWDFYTLCGRLPGLEEDKEKFRDLMNLMSGTSDTAETQEQTQTVNATQRNDCDYLRDCENS